MPSCDVSIQGLIPPLGWEASGYQPLSDALAESHSALQMAVPGTRAVPRSPRPRSFQATCDIEESHTCFVGSLPEKPCHVPFPLMTQKTSAPPHKGLTEEGEALKRFFLISSCSEQSCSLLREQTHQSRALLHFLTTRGVSASPFVSCR